MNRIFIFTISILLFYSSKLQKNNFDNQNLKYPQFYSYFFNNYSSKKIAGLHYAILTGDKKKLGIKIKKAFKNLFLFHYLTPSGLHIGILSFFLKKLQFLLLFIFILEGFLAAKRILLLNLTKTVFKKNLIQKNFLSIFCFQFYYWGLLQQPS